MEQSTPYRVALYGRVSTADQSTDAQVGELRQWAERYGWAITDEYIDAGWSGAKKDRPELARLMADARHRRFDAVLVFKLDRFGRSSQHCIAQIRELTNYGVRFLCTSQGIDTDQSNPTSKLLLNLLAAFAEFERELICERVRSGQAHARSKGTHMGRPARVLDRTKMAELRAAGQSYRQIAQEFKCAPCLVYRRLKSLEAAA